MARTIDPDLTGRDAVVFLALCWGGGEARALPDLLFLYDWVSHDIPTAAELDGALNRLLAAGLLAQRRGGFAVPPKVARRFHEFRRRRRRDRFEMARQFVQSAGPLRTVPRRVTVGRGDLERAYAEYQRRFAEALEMPSR
jgi:hypothetical protein